MKLSDLFESETIILEARHDDMWKEFTQALLRNAKRDLDNGARYALLKLMPEGSDQMFLTPFTNSVKHYEGIIKELSVLDIHNSWKQWLVGFAIASMSSGILGGILEDFRAAYTKAVNYLETKVKNTPSENIFFSILVQRIRHYSAIDYAPLKEYNPLVNNDTPKTFLKALEELEEEYKERSEEGYISATGEEKLLVKVGDMAWYNLGKSYCKEEGSAMVHCGNEEGKRRTTDRILSLRTVKYENSQELHKPHLTFILMKGGILGEMKGRGNDKPAKRYHEAIIALLKLPIIKGINGGGYKPENNFSLEDLTQSQLEDLKKSKGNEWFEVNELYKEISKMKLPYDPNDDFSGMRSKEFLVNGKRKFKLYGDYYIGTDVNLDTLGIYLKNVKDNRGYDYNNLSEDAYIEQVYKQNPDVGLENNEATRKKIKEYIYNYQEKWLNDYEAILGKVFGYVKTDAWISSDHFRHWNICFDMRQVDIDVVKRIMNGEGIEIPNLEEHMAKLNDYKLPEEVIADVKGAYR